MVDDGRLFTGRCADCSALATLEGKRCRMLERAFSNSQSFDPDSEAGIVHHLEHVSHALVFLADEVTDRALTGIAVGDDAGWAGVQT